MIIKNIFYLRHYQRKNTITMAMILVKVFHSEWASARGINGDITDKTKTELDANLKFFYTDDTATNYEKLETMYQTAHQNDGFNALRLYCNKLNPACHAFFQFP